jgi:hypothetical protein
VVGEAGALESPALPEAAVLEGALLDRPAEEDDAPGADEPPVAFGSPGEPAATRGAEGPGRGADDVVALRDAEVRGAGADVLGAGVVPGSPGTAAWTGTPSSPITTTEPAVLCAPDAGVSRAAGGGSVTVPETTGTARNSAAMPSVIRQPSSSRTGTPRGALPFRARRRGRVLDERAAREPRVERWRTDVPPGSLIARFVAVETIGVSIVTHGE